MNRFAHYVRGVDAIVALHRPIHETIYRDSTLENELIDATPVGDAATVVHFWSRLRIGAAYPDACAFRAPRQSSGALVSPRRGVS